MHISEKKKKLLLVTGYLFAIFMRILMQYQRILTFSNLISRGVCKSIFHILISLRCILRFILLFYYSLHFAIYFIISLLNTYMRFTAFYSIIYLLSALYISFSLHKILLLYCLSIHGFARLPV